MRGLYAIVDVGTLTRRGLDPVWLAEAILVARPAALQLRAKDLPARETLNLLRALAPMCHRAGVPLVANDRADLATFAGCDMVHIGQQDISIDLVRRLAPKLGVGISTHSIAELDAALAARPTYVAFGPVFSTSTKTGAGPALGIALLEEAAARARACGVPLVAIGGVAEDNAASVGVHADAGAVISALVPADVAGPSKNSDEAFRRVTARAAALNALLGSGPLAVQAASA
jgi:thiamine-phosphate pyrophosphorylase